MKRFTVVQKYWAMAATALLFVLVVVGIWYWRETKDMVTVHVHPQGGDFLQDRGAVEKWAPTFRARLRRAGYNVWSVKAESYPSWIGEQRTTFHKVVIRVKPETTPEDLKAWTRKFGECLLQDRRCSSTVWFEGLPADADPDPPINWDESHRCGWTMWLTIEGDTPNADADLKLYAESLQQNLRKVAAKYGYTVGDVATLGPTYKLSTLHQGGPYRFHVDVQLHALPEARAFDGLPTEERSLWWAIIFHDYHGLQACGVSIGKK